jgi:hypothetical protein
VTSEGPAHCFSGRSKGVRRMISETVSSTEIVYLLSALFDLQRQSEGSDNTLGDYQ